MTALLALGLVCHASAPALGTAGTTAARTPPRPVMERAGPRRSKDSDLSRPARPAPLVAALLPPNWQRACRYPFCIHFPPRLSRRAARLLAAAPWIHARVSQILGADLPWAQVAMTDHTRDLRRLLPPGSHPPEWAAALAFRGLAYIVLGPRATLASPQRLVRILAHEYSHVALDYRLRGRQVPRWFVEGLADLQGMLADPLDPFSVGRELPLNLLSRRFPGSADLASEAYSQSRDFVAYLYNLEGPEGLRRLVDLLARGVPLETAIQEVYGRRVSELERDWRRQWRYRKVLLPLATSGALLWLGAIVLLLVGYARRRRRMRQMEDERALTEEEGQVAPEPAPPPAQAPPAVVILAALGLAVLLAALVETVLPRVTWTTLVLTTAIPLSLVFILLWRTGRLSPPEESGREANEEPPDRDEAAGDDPGDT